VGRGRANIPLPQDSPCFTGRVGRFLARMMRVLFCFLTACGLAGCATDSQGRRESPLEAVQRWEDSMDSTINRLQDKSYPD
jgi:hypothetical protein